MHPASQNAVIPMAPKCFRCLFFIMVPPNPHPMARSHPWLDEMYLVAFQARANATDQASDTPPASYKVSTTGLRSGPQRLLCPTVAAVLNLFRYQTPTAAHRIVPPWWSSELAGNAACTPRKWRLPYSFRLPAPLAARNQSS